MAEIREIIERVVTEADARGVIETTRALLDLAGAEDALRGSIDGVTRSSEAQDKTAESVQRRYDRMRGSLDAAYRAQQAYERDVRTLTTSQQQLGLSTQEVANMLLLLQERHFGAARAAEAMAAAEAAAAKAARLNMQGMGGLTLAEARAQSRALAPMNMGALGAFSAIPTGTAQAAEAAAGGLRNARHEAQMLQYQMFDMGTMVAAGSSPLMIMATQGPQIAQQLGGQGVRGAVTALGGAFMGLLTPVNAAIAGFAALAVGIGYVWSRWDDGAPNVEEALKRQVELAGQLRDIYGAAAENALRAVPPNLAETRFTAGMDLKTLQAKSLEDTKAFLQEVGNYTRAGLIPESEFAAFAKPLNDLSHSALAGQPAIDQFRRDIVAMAGVAPEAARQLLDLSRAIQDVTQPRRNEFLSRLDPDALSRALRSGQGYEALDRQMQSPRQPSVGVPIPRANPAFDLGQDLTKIRGTDAADQASLQAVLAASDKRAQQLGAEVGLYGQGKQAIDAYRIAQEMQAEAVRAGIELDAKKIALINQRAQAEAAAAAAMQAAQERQREFEREAQQRVEERRRQAEDDAKFWENSASGMLKGLSRLQDPKQMLINFGYKLGDRLIDEGLSGKGDVLGALKGLLTGKGGAADLMPKMVGTQYVTAGSVIVSGGISLSGLGGLPGLGKAGAAAGGIGSDAKFPVGVLSAPIPSALDQVARESVTRSVARSAPDPQSATQALASLAGSGNLGFRPGINTGIDPRLLDILQTTAERGGWNAQMISGLRPGDPRFHGKGMAADIALFDRAGNKLPNYQNGAAFRQYETFAQQARAYQMERYPELSGDLRWGGYFGGPKGKYGALDTMHFDLGGSRVGMAGGSWEYGLNSRQMARFPGAQSLGMAEGGLVPFAQVGQKFQAVIPPLQQMPGALDAMKQATQGAGGALGQLPGLLSGLGGGGGGGGGLIGLLMGLFGGGKADGGWISGPGGPRGDKILTPTSDGEYVVNAAAAAQHAGLLEAINSGRLRLGRGRADGGWVGQMQDRVARESASFLAGGGPGTTKSTTNFRSGDINITVHGKADDKALKNLEMRLRSELDARDRAMMEAREKERSNAWRYGSGDGY